MKKTTQRLYTLKQIQEIAEVHDFSLMTTDEKNPQITVSVAEDADPFGIFTQVTGSSKFKFKLYFA